MLPRLERAGWSSRFLFFTGKGGVGKTTVAVASALALVDIGRRVLVVSTDPAPSEAREQSVERLKSRWIARFSESWESVDWQNSVKVPANRHILGG